MTEGATEIGPEGIRMRVEGREVMLPADGSPAYYEPRHEPHYTNVTVPIHKAGVVLLWGDESVTTLIDGGRGGRVIPDDIDSLLRSLMALRLRHIADELDAQR